MALMRGASLVLATRCPLFLRGLVSAVFALVCGAGVWAIDSWTYAVAEIGNDDGCPRAALREMMVSATSHNDVGDVAALELEVLRLCNERQKLLVRVMEGEARLAELRGVKRAAGAEPGANTMMMGLLDGLPSPGKASVQPRPSGVPEPTSRSLLLEPAIVPRPGAGDSPSATLRWTTVYGSAGNWVAGMTDGTETWYLREGDELPSGVRVESIRNRPPGVRVGLDGKKWQIPGPGTASANAEGTGRVDAES